MPQNPQANESLTTTFAERVPSDAAQETLAGSIKSTLEQILSSDGFRQSHRLQQFLRFIVYRTLEHSGEPLKEYVIGIEVFGRKESFDPRLDPIVRVEAGRLRKKLKRYYETAGRTDSVRIELPKRTYTPVFVSARETHEDVKLVQLRSKRVWVGLALGLAVLLSVISFREAIWSPSGISAFSDEAGSLQPGRTALTSLGSGGVAVLPFADLSPGRDQEYFCDGLTEELINTLAQVDGLQVVPRTSTFRFKGGGHDIVWIGQQLGVGTVLEGSVRKAGNRLRVAVQAIDVVGGYTFWAKTYDAPMTDVFAVQTEIAAATVSVLKDRIDRPLANPLSRQQTDNVDAFNSYLLGRYYWNKRTEESLFKAIVYFDEALSQDPQYALAYSGLADSYALLVNYGGLPPREAMTKAKAAALKALAVDPNLAEAHTSLAYVLTYYEWNWPEAEQHFRRALELNPNYSDAHQWFSAYLSLMGRHEESAKHLGRAREIDPLSVMLNYRIASSLFSDGNFSESIEQCRRTIDLDPAFPHTYRLLGRIFEQQGHYDKAIDAFEKGRVLSGGKPQYTALIARIHAQAGREEMALDLLAELLQLAQDSYVFAVDIASVYASLGDTEQTTRWLERAYQDRSPWLIGSIMNRNFGQVRSDARFVRLYEKLRLPATARQPTH